MVFPIKSENLEFSSLRRSRRIFTVFEVVRRIRKLVEGGLPSYLGVEGEIANLRKPLSGHIYFTLKDAFSSLRVVIFRSSGVDTPLKDGVKVVVWGRIRVYEERGRLELVGEKVEVREGRGKIYEEFLKLKERLAREGLFAEERKKPLPPFPRKIGIITSPTGSAIRDMLKIILRRFPRVEIVIFPVKVQGDNASYEIVEGIETLNRMGEVEVIIVGRGGGSIEDLQPFNEERVARAIFRSRIPVISAVGHETDYCISDFVADLRAPTPSAAAELVVKEMESIFQSLESFQDRLLLRMNEECRKWREKIIWLEKTLNSYHPVQELERKKDKFVELRATLFRSMETLLTRKEETLKGVMERLDALSPLKVLQRGYSITFLLPHLKILRDSKEVKTGDRVKIKLWKGNIVCEVERKDESSDTL